MLTHHALHRLAPALFTSRRGLPPEIPGPPPSRWLSTGGPMLLWGRDTLGHAGKLFREHGDVVALVQGGGMRHIAQGRDCPGTVLCFGPEHNSRVTSEHEVFSKGSLVGSLFPGETPPANKRALLSFGSGLFSVNGEEHKRHRRLLMPLFSRQKLVGYCSEMRHQTELELGRWQPGEVRDVAADMRRLTCAIVSRTLLGTGEGAEIESAALHLKQVLRLMGAPATKLLAFDLPGLPYRRYLQAAASLEEKMLAIIAARRGEQQSDDMLGALIRARDEESGARLSPREILGHVSVFFAAGHETSANALTWTLLLLASHPAVAERAAAELDQVLAGSPPTPEHLEQLSYLGWVIKESLRLFPPAPWNGRILTRDARLGRFTIPAGAEVLFSIYETHRMPELYERPLAFLPERWESLKRTPYEYSPFSAGPRTCIGAAFASLEIKLVLALLLRRFRLSLVPQKIERFAELTLSPRSGLRMRVHPADGQHQRSPARLRGNLHDMVELPPTARA